jgi:hypothetical protein
VCVKGWVGRRARKKDMKEAMDRMGWVGGWRAADRLPWRFECNEGYARRHGGFVR